MSKYRVEKSNEKTKKNFLYFIPYLILFFVYSILSYSLTTPNLVLSTFTPYWNFQNFMWRTFFNNGHLLTYCFFTIFFLLSVNYLLLIKKSKTFRLSLVAILLAASLFFSYNALSHDVFNYIFNAKIVAVYHANPHIKVALDYVNIDDWVRFMHNVHTPAPYGYGWTALSLLPYSIGFNKFLPTYYSFRLFSIISIVLLYLTLNYLSKEKFNKKLTFLQTAVLFFNPLFLIEIISNFHNDLWMMTPALLSLALLIKPKTWKVILSILLLSFSISTKLATIVLIPIWLFFLIKKTPWQAVTDYLNKNWAEISSVFLFLPLLTPRSQLFHPWYLIWVMVWLPFIKNKTWKNTIIVFSISSLFRYLPWMWAGDYENKVLSYQQTITWLIPVLYFCISFIIARFKTKKS